MKIAINQWAFPADMSTTEALSYARRMGFEAFEICTDESSCLPLEVSEAEVTAIRRHAETVGIELSSLACGLGWRYPLSSPDAAVRSKGKEVVGKALQVAAWLGVDTLLTVPGTVTPDCPYDEALERCIVSLRDLLPAAEKHKVTIAVENVWNKFLLSPVEMRDFIDQFDHPFLGAYFDTGNIMLYGYPEQWIRILGKRIKAVHAKDFRVSAGNFDGFVMLMEGDVDWPSVVAALRDTGYKGPLVAEFAPYKHSLDAMLRHVVASLEAIRSL